MSPPRNVMQRAQRVGWVLALIGALGSIAYWIFLPQEFYEAWLIGWFFWFSIAIGNLGFFMIYRLSGGEWGKPLERIFVCAGSSFEILAFLFIPLLFGVHTLYEWSHPERWVHAPSVVHKFGYLNEPLWIVRSAGYLILAWALARAVRVFAETGVKRWSAAGLVILFLAVSFAGIDWIMSLEPEWYSTVYGLLILTGQGLAGFSFALVVLHTIHRRYPQWQIQLSEKVLLDLGSLLLTASILWTYVSFVQWLIVWIGNEPESASWYVTRAENTWQFEAWWIVLGQFFIPFQLLLWRRFKAKLQNLAALGLLILFVHGFELDWLVRPALHERAFPINAGVIFTGLCVGGIWWAIFLRRLRSLKLKAPASPWSVSLREVLHA